MSHGVPSGSPHRNLERERSAFKGHERSFVTRARRLWPIILETAADRLGSRNVSCIPAVLPSTDFTAWMRPLCPRLHGGRATRRRFASSAELRAGASTGLRTGLPADPPAAHSSTSNCRFLDYLIINLAYKYRPGKSGTGMPRRGDKPREPGPGVYRSGRQPVNTTRVFTGLINHSSKLPRDYPDVGA
jgi:hypothetical protein